MIRDLLTPEAQESPYVWSAVLTAHAGIGVALWTQVENVWVVALLYALFELVQGLVARRFLVWDTILDWNAVTWGALLGWAIATGNDRMENAVILSLLLLVTVGAKTRAS